MYNEVKGYTPPTIPSGEADLVKDGDETSKLTIKPANYVPIPTLRWVRWTAQKLPFNLK